MDNQAGHKKQYFDYLVQRSLLSKVYRNRILYPKISRYITGKTLDIGCGIGDFLQYRKNTIGIDINQYNIEYCVGRGLEAYLVNADDKFPFADQVFEGAVLDNVIEHLADPSPILREIHRILVHNGMLIVGVPGVKGFNADRDHKRFYDKFKLIELLKYQGFANKTFFYAPLFESEWLSKNMSQYCIYGVFIKPAIKHVSSPNIEKLDSRLNNAGMTSVRM